MIKSVIVSIQETFAGQVMFLACEAKQERVDRNDARSPMQIVPGKWTVQLSVKPLSKDGKAQRENINVTVESKVNPCEGMQEFTPVILDHLEYNVMVNDRTGKVQPWFTLGGLRPAAAAGQAGNAAR